MKRILPLIVILSVVLIDQAVKIEIKTGFSLFESVRVTDWFRILFTENKGMAFGMSFIGTSLLAAFRVVAIAFFVYLMTRLIKHNAPNGLIVCVSLIIAGALGNLIDNAFYGMIFSESLAGMPPAEFVPFGSGYAGFMSGRVVDMFYFPLFTWPDWMPFVGGEVFFGAVFNVADAAICCGAAALLLFYYKSLSSLRIH